MITREKTTEFIIERPILIKPWLNFDFQNASDWWIICCLRKVQGQNPEHNRPFRLTVRPLTKINNRINWAYSTSEPFE